VTESSPCDQRTNKQQVKVRDEKGEAGADGWTPATFVACRSCHGRLCCGHCSRSVLSSSDIRLTCASRSPVRFSSLASSLWKLRLRIFSASYFDSSSCFSVIGPYPFPLWVCGWGSSVAILTHTVCTLLLTATSVLRRSDTYVCPKGDSRNST